MYTEREIKKQFAEVLRYVPKEHRRELRQRYKEGEFDFCRTNGLIRIRYALEFYPEYSAQVLKENYRGVSDWDIGNKLREIIPNFTETPISDAFRKSLEGYLAISKAVSKLIVALEAYPPQAIPEFRRAETAMLIPWAQGKLRWWLEGGDQPGSTLESPVIEAEASTVEETSSIINPNKEN